MENTPMTAPERIKFLIEHCSNGSTRTFANSIGIDLAYVSRIANGKGPLAPKTIKAILYTYPNINPDWLKTGDGYPGDLSVADIKARYEAIIAEKDEMIRTLMRVIEEKLGAE